MPLTRAIRHVLVAGMLILPACATEATHRPTSDPEPGRQARDSRLARHGHARVWKNAVTEMGSSSLQWAPMAAMAVAFPIAANNDTQWSASLIGDPLVGEPKKHGDLLLQGMMGATAAWTAYEWYQGDEGSSAEVLLESAVLTTAIVESVKGLTERQRPAGSNSDSSFPSGHSATAFITATFVARRVDDLYDGPTGYLGYLAYLPAAAVALNRVENARHYPSDVVAGMLLGTALTHLFYNAHFGSEDEPGILEPRFRLTPQVGDDYVGLGMTVRF